MVDYLTELSDNVQAYFSTHKIPSYFYQCLFGECVKIWGVRFLIPDENYDAEYNDDGSVIPSNSEYSYEDQIGYYCTMLSGTSGWGIAFNEACIQSNLLWLHQDYKQMDWMSSDIFDGYIVDAMIDVLFAKDAKSDYYFFKIKKEN